ncbi:HNH endonuclease [Bacillus cereus]|uniref:HNH endonuclease n=1 Tax=Bacillus cereus TaxID=1396 RepID=UPI003877ED74
MKKYNKSMANKEYVKGRSKETEFYILTAKFGDKDYRLTLLRNHSIIFERHYDGLTASKFGAFEWLLNYDSSIFEKNKVNMVHYKEDRPNTDPWVKDTNIELHKNLKSFFNNSKIKPDIIVQKDATATQEIRLLEDESHSFDAEITETEKEQVIKSRIGQSTFKKSLLAIQQQCRLCGVSDERFLVASHIKPWIQSNHKERLDVNNGLLLCPNHDALFDKGYISFNEDGTILVSESLAGETKVFLNINGTMRVTLNEGQQKYMKWHRENMLTKN